MASPRRAQASSLAECDVRVESLRGMTLRRGAFVLSLDFELIWGTLDVCGPERFRAACERERSEVFGALLALLEEFAIPATWCVLGHVMLDSCAADNGR